MWHRQGKVSLTKGSDVVTGAGTNWVENIRVGDAFQGPDGKLYQVINVASNEALAISPAYEGNTATNLNYWVVPVPGYSKTQADRLSLIISKLDGDIVTATEAADRAQAAATQASQWRNEASVSAAAALQSEQNAALSADIAEQARDDAVAVVTDGQGSTTPAPGKFPVAGTVGTIQQAWVDSLEFELDALRVARNKLMYGDGPYPVLDFQFQGARMLDPRIEFTRASKDWDWKGLEYGINEPVFSGEGLQMVGPRTNLLTQSSNLASTAWTRRERITPNVALAPNGTSAAAKLTEIPVENAWQSINQSAGAPSVGETYTVSAYFKKAERSIAYLRLMGSQFYYDLETGEEYHRIGANQSLVNKGIVPVGDGWFLVYLSVKLEGERTSYDVGLGVAQEVKFDGFIYQGDGVSGLYVWQPVLKVGVLSPPVFTVGSQVTVAKTSLVVPNRGELSNSEGSLILCVDALFRDSVHSYCRFNFASGGYIGFRYVPTTHYIDVYGWLDGTGTIVDTSNTPYQQVRKIGFSYSGREFVVCVNGGAVEPLQLQADMPEIASLFCNLSAVTQSITSYNQALTPTQLQELTS